MRTEREREIESPFDFFELGILILGFVDWVFFGLLIVVEMGFMIDCRVVDLGEFDASLVT
jgi:hypothetical protein